jgi:hypothetical protein
MYLVYINILVNKRNNTKIFFKYIYMLKAKTNTNVYYHVCQLQCFGLSFVLPVCGKRVISLGMVFLDTFKWSATAC